MRKVGQRSCLARASLAVAGVLIACESSAGPHTPDPDDGLVVDDASVSPLDATTEPDAREDTGVDTAVQTDAAEAPDAAPPPECNVVLPQGCPTPAPRYADVAPIFEEYCVTCHSPTWSEAWPLDQYRHVADWQDDIRAHLLTCTMPPPAANVPIPESESMRILQWIQCGLPM